MLLSGISPDNTAVANCVFDGLNIFRPIRLK